MKGYLALTLRACFLWGGSAALLSLVACSEPEQPAAIPSSGGEAATIVYQRYSPRPVQYAIPAHPYMASQGVNSMHSDSYSSDVHPSGGPLAENVRMTSRRGGRAGGQCATLTFDRDGRLIALCAQLTGFRLHLLTPRSLQLLAEYKLPVRPSTYEALVHRDKSRIMEDSSGAYFYLDNQDRVVMADSDQVVHRIGHRQKADGRWEFYRDASWNLGDIVPNDCLRPTNPFPAGECDPVTGVMPDYDGRIWWVTRAGRLGTIDQQTGAVQAMRLEGEEIQNGFSVAADGVYIVSDHALYGFDAAADGRPRIRWREEYDRGTSRKVGTINQGSGTTPTLFGDYVTITDNADGRMNLLVYRRLPQVRGERLVCKVPLFEEGKSVTDNSMVAVGRAIILENNAGFTSVYGQKDWSEVAGGIARIDVREDESGCDRVWQSGERSPSVVPKLSAGNGVVYFYTFEPLGDGSNAWYLTGLDFRTGTTLFRIHTGNGPNFNNNWAPITLAPDGTAYVGTSRGLVAIWDAG